MPNRFHWANLSELHQVSRLPTWNLHKVREDIQKKCFFSGRTLTKVLPSLPTLMALWSMPLSFCFLVS